MCSSYSGILLSEAHRQRKSARRKLARQAQPVDPVQLEPACDTDAYAETRSPSVPLPVVGWHHRQVWNRDLEMLRAWFNISDSLTVQVCKPIICVFFRFPSKRFRFYKFERNHFCFYIISVSTNTTVSVSVNVRSIISVFIIVSVTEISLVVVWI